VLQAELDTFFMEHHFYMQEWPTNTQVDAADEEQKICWILGLRSYCLSPPKQLGL
jgi:hypothetical protein